MKTSNLVLRLAIGLFCILMLVLNMPSAILHSQSNPSTDTDQSSETDDDGSSETLKEGPIKEALIDRNQIIHVFESINNTKYLNAKNYSAMKFFVAPLVDIVPYSEATIYARTELTGSGVAVYAFRLQNYAEFLREEALRLVNRQYSSKTGRDDAIELAQVTVMEHGLVVIKPVGPLSALINPVTIPNDATEPLDTRVSLQPDDTFFIEVPLQVDADFRTLVDAGLKFEFRIYFNVKDISSLNLNFNAEELLTTERYKNLEQTGAAFVTAEQYQEVFREAVRNQNIRITEDPGIDARLRDYALKMFEKLLESSVTIAANSAAEATAIDRELAAGIGLNPSDFAPVTLMWQVHEIIKNAENRTQANDQLQEWYARDKNEVETVRERFKESEWKVKAKASYGVGGFGASGSAEYRELNRAFDKNETASLSDTIDQGFFRSDDSFSEAHETHRDASGVEVEIVARGLNLIERAKFQNKVQQLINIEISVPTNRPSSFTFSQNTPTNVAEYHDKLDDLLTRIEVLGEVLGGAVKVASGSTEAGNSNWQPYNKAGVYIDVDTSAAGFTETPHYIVSLHGTGHIWETTGGSEVYRATSTGFRIHVRFPDGRKLTPAFANSKKWHIVWVGVKE